MLQHHIVVVDDDTALTVFLRDILEGQGYTVSTASNGAEGLKLVKQLRPNLVVLDVMMPVLDGYEVCRRLKKDLEVSHIPILMLTAKGQVVDKVTGLTIGADDYLSKPCDKSEFEARVGALLRRAHYRYPSRAMTGVCKMEMLLLPWRPIQLALQGGDTFTTSTQATFRIDESAAEVYERRVQNARQSHDWRFESKNIGQTLSEQIFQIYPEVSNCYSRARGEASEEANLHLVFKTPRTFLRLPFEFMFGDGDYLALRHPMSRYITDSHARHPSISGEMLNALLDRREELRVLLVASNTGNIDAVDEEVAALNDLFNESLFPGLTCAVTYIPTIEATYNRVRNELRRGRYHIFHYAGHGLSSSTSSEESCLYFWEKPDGKGNVLPMKASELVTLLRDSDLRFVYLSCCWGSASGSTSQLLDDDFLGIADGIIQAGVSAVLGTRWPISDCSAKTLALSFYESLSRQGELDTALLDARCEIAALDRDDKTWLSPILIVQA